MRRHSTGPSMSRPRREKVHAARHEHHWITRHPRFVAVVLAVLVTGLIAALFSIIQLYLAIGIWPLFG